jgi:spoIIIJ-associated protein
MKVIEVSGKSVEDATKKAAAELGIQVAHIKAENIEVLDEGKSGIFGFGVSRSAKIRVSYDSTTKDIADTVREVITTLFKKMELHGSIGDLHEGESKVYVELQSRNSGLIIGKKGKTLEALQFMVNLIVSHKTESEKKIILDIESYRSKRERALKKLSRDIARRVASSGRPWTLDPMNPFERRLIHLTLQNDDKVITKSEGQGIYRKVVISPKRRGR